VTTVRTLAFAEGDTGSWGAAWLPADDASGPLACRVGSVAAVLTAELHDTAQSEPWRVDGEGVSLVFVPAGRAGQSGPRDTGIESLEQLCDVKGKLAVDGSEREITCMGWRASLEGGFELAEIDSFRQICGWFEPDRGVALLALRPRKARAHDADLVAAAVLEPEPTPRVADPRLSTTYDAAGLPARVGLELWLEAESSANGADDDADRQFPRRAAGEATGAGIEWEVAGFTLHAALLRWHSRGSDGTGVYLLGQRA
jgi:hypothetical protein